MCFSGANPELELLRKYLHEGDQSRLDHLLLELQRRYHDGDMPAGSALWLFYEPVLEELSLKYAGGDATIAEDARQQTYVEICDPARRLFSRYDPNLAWQTWVNWRVHKRILDEFRSRARHVFGSLTALKCPAAALGPDSEIVFDDLLELVTCCIGELPEENRQALRARFSEHQQTYEEIGRTLDIGASTVQRRVTRALSQLRRCLEAKGNIHDF